MEFRSRCYWSEYKELGFSRATLLINLIPSKPETEQYPAATTSHVEERVRLL
jgi:hypothetical protein